MIVMLKQFVNGHGRQEMIKNSCNVVLGVGLLIGIILRLRMYLMNRSLWLDTVCLATNVVEKDLPALFGKLEFSQSAPVGFLLISKIIGSVFNYSELSLTFIPFLSALAALILFLFLSTDVLGKSAAFVAFIPFTCCSTAIYYAGEFKQYSSDLLFSVLILLVVYQTVKKGFSTKYIIIFGIVGIIGVWFSHIAIIMISGTGCALFLIALQNRSWRELKILVCTGLMVLAHFLLMYTYIIKPATSERMFSYWSDGFAPIWPLSIETLTWWYETVVGYMSYPLGFHDYVIWIALGFLVFGFAFSWKERSTREIMLVLCLPAIVVIILSTLSLYPIVTGKYEINARLILFTVPIAFIMIALGIKKFAHFFPSPILVIALLAIFLSYTSVKKMILWPTYMRQEMRPLVSHLLQNVSPDDSIYVYERAVPAFMFYTRGNPLTFYPGTTIEIDSLRQELGKTLAGKKVWFVLAHTGMKNREAIIQELEKKYSRVNNVKFPGAWLLSVQNNL